MAERVNDSKVITFFFPSLFYLVNRTLSFRLYEKYIIGFDIKLEEGTFTEPEIEREEEEWENRANEYFWLIPEHLRLRVHEQLIAFGFDIETWRDDLSMFLSLCPMKCFRLIHWRWDGTVDTVKTAQHLVLDESIEIGKRFEVACMYCLEENVKTLWAEMEASGKANDYVPAENSTSSFWIRWIQDGSNVPWTRVIPSKLDPLRWWNIRFSRFFPSLKPEDRGVFLPSIRSATLDDLRFCLHAMDQKEEEEMLAVDFRKLLLLTLRWPLQCKFIDTVEKTWDFIDADIFHFLIREFSKHSEFWLDLIYCELFLDFWKRSPNYLKESAKEDPDVKKLVDSLFDGIRRLSAKFAHVE